jgi:anthranilate phosphoribosyltransferase
MDFKIGSVLETLAKGEMLDKDTATACFEQLMDGKLSPAQAGALLMGLKAKGETAEELAAAVNAALKRAKLVPGLSGKRIDTCGTGGDGSSSFNCSTTTALVLAGMGYSVVKHGNRSVSSKSGSADVLEAMGFPLDTPPEAVAGELEARNFVFLFAPMFHPAFKHIMPVRKELGCRTLFNLLGPMLNPARPSHQLIGVALPEVAERMAQVTAMGDVASAAVVHGAGGFDELTPFGKNAVWYVEDGKVDAEEFDPADYGFKAWQPEDVAVRGPEHSKEVLLELLSGKGPEAMQDMTALNVGMCVYLYEEDMAMEEAMEHARDALAQGLGEKVLHAG